MSKLFQKVAILICAASLKTDFKAAAQNALQYLQWKKEIIIILYKYCVYNIIFH